MSKWLAAEPVQVHNPASSPLEKPGLIGLEWEEMLVHNVGAESSEERWAASCRSSQTNIPWASTTVKVFSQGRNWGWSKEEASWSFCSACEWGDASNSLVLWVFPYLLFLGRWGGFPSVPFSLLHNLIDIICTCMVLLKASDNIILVLRGEKYTFFVSLAPRESRGDSGCKKDLLIII